MPHTTVRQIHGEEMLEIMHWLPGYAFQASPPLGDKAARQEALKQRKGVIHFALFEDDVAVSCASSTPMSQQVRGVIYRMGGIFDVVTHPAARRKGYSRRVLTRLMTAIHEEGRPFACLYPFRESFYERLGYVSFPLPRIARFDPSTLRPHARASLAGQVELTLIGDGYDAYIEYMSTLQHRIHGMGLFEHSPKVRIQQRNNFWLAMAMDGQEPVGLMMYDLRGEHETEFNLRAIRFYYHASLGRYLLLNWIARHIDQANQVELWLPPYEQPELWLPDLQIKSETVVRAPMGRIVDLSAVAGMKTGPGRFTARVNDPVCPWNEGIWQFETVDGDLHVTQADRAECELSIQAVGALIYGTHAPADFAMRGWGDPSQEVQAAMQQVFPPMRPYLHEFF